MLFEQLHAVEELVLRGNDLTELPASTWQLSSLRALDLSDNRLAALLPDVADLQQLQVWLKRAGICLATCRRELLVVFALPAGIAGLQQLQVRYARHVHMCVTQVQMHDFQQGADTP